MKLRVELCVAVMIALVMQAAVAAAAIGPVKIGVGGGFSVPVSHAKDALQTGFHARAMVKWSLPALPIGLRGTFGYERMDLKELSPGLDGNGAILSGLGNVTLGATVGPIRPYILAGLGAFNMRTAVTGSSTASETRFGIDGGAGMEFNLGMVSGFIEGRIENIFTDEGFSSSLGNAEEFSTRIIPVTFGVYF